MFIILHKSLLVLHQVEPGLELLSLNLSLVGLCREIDCDDLFPHCVGLGLLRSIDPISETMHIITPVCIEQLSTVTIIIRGRLPLPAALLFEVIS